MSEIVAQDTPAAKPAAPSLKGGQLAIMTVAVALASFMEVLDTTIVNVSVPTISGNLAVSANQGTWAISSYSVSAAIAVPLTGWLAKRFGEVKLFTWSVTLFTIMSVLCGFATSLPMLVFFRLLQGLVSGPMVPLSQTLLLANYPAEKKGIALAIWAMTVIVAPICGPLLGGYITDNYNWPWIFYINLPVGIFSVITVFTLLRRRDTPTVKQPIDVVGLVLMVLGVGCLQLMLDNGNDLDWFSSRFIVTLAIVAVIALTFFVAWELTDKHPIVDLTLFKGRNFTVGVLALSLGFFCFFGSTVMFPLWLQTVMGYTPSWAGMATAPVGILALLLSPIVGKNIARLDLRVMSTIAFAIFGTTQLWYASFNLDTNFGTILLPRIVQGIGVACFFVPVSQIVLSGLSPDKLASASGLSNFFRTLGAAFATAITVTVWDHRAGYHHAQMTEQINAFNPTSVDYVSRLQSLGITPEMAYGRINQVIDQQSFMYATTEVFWLYGMVFFALIAVAWFAKPPFGSTGGVGGH